MKLCKGYWFISQDFFPITISNSTVANDMDPRTIFLWDVTVHQSQLPGFFDDGDRILQSNYSGLDWTNTFSKHFPERLVDTHFTTLVIDRCRRHDFFTCKLSCQLLKLLLLICQLCGLKQHICRYNIIGFNTFTVFLHEMTSFLTAHWPNEKPRDELLEDAASAAAAPELCSRIPDLTPALTNWKEVHQVTTEPHQ